MAYANNPKVLIDEGIEVEELFGLGGLVRGVLLEALLGTRFYLFFAVIILFYLRMSPLWNIWAGKVRRRQAPAHLSISYQIPSPHFTRIPQGLYSQHLTHDVIYRPNFMSPARILHAHLGRCTYTHGTKVQTQLVNAFMLSKAHPTRAAPAPTILTSEFSPVYTLGRREQDLLTPELLSKLTSHGAEVHTTLRGGQTTFHGPGQLTAYVVLDLKSHRLTPRCYVRMLESALIGTCARYGIRAFTTENTGVWTSGTRKIAAVGVHMRRNITSHGVGLNVSTNTDWFERIVPCGLEGVDTWSFEKEGVLGKSVEEVGGVFSEEVAKLVGCGEVKRVEKLEVLSSSAASN